MVIYISNIVPKAKNVKKTFIEIMNEEVSMNSICLSDQ